MDSSSNLLDEALGFDHQARVVLIEDCVDTSGAFVLHHLIKRSLSLNSSGVVLFVALAQPFSHYERILRKLIVYLQYTALDTGTYTRILLVLSVKGCNLVAQRENRRFFFFDMLKQECSGNTIEGGLFELYGKIQKAVEVSALPEHNGSGITIMIDDMSLMEVAAHGSSNCVLDFLHYCHTLTSEIGCSLVILNHEDIYSSMMGPTLILQMEYLADLVIKAEPLTTGLATDVHGQLTVVNKGIVDEHGSLRNKIHNFHFKVKENSVEYFYPGSQT